MRLKSLSLLLLLVARTGAAIDLKAETAEAYDGYISELEARMETRLHGQHFLWPDETPGLTEQLLQGTVSIRPASGNGLIAVKNGLIQDWIGAVFIPHSSLAAVMAIVQDYDRHKEIYKPEIADSKTRGHQGDEFQVYLRIVKSKFFLSDVLNSENKIRYFPLDPKRVYSRSYSTRIAEVSNAGKAGEHELPVGEDRGLLWRFYSYWFFEERDGGVFVACESVTLTRDIPFGMGKLIGPIIHDVPGESLQTSLEQLRKAVADK